MGSIPVGRASSRQALLSRVEQIPLAGILPEHNPATAAGGGERRQRRFGSHLDLPWTRRAAQLLDTISVHSRARAPVPQIAAAGAERMWTFDADITSVKGKRLPALNAVPLEPF